MHKSLQWLSRTVSRALLGSKMLHVYESWDFNKHWCFSALPSSSLQHLAFCTFWIFENRYFHLHPFLYFFFWSHSAKLLKTPSSFHPPPPPPPSPSLSGSQKVTRRLLISVSPGCRTWQRSTTTRSVTQRQQCAWFMLLPWWQSIWACWRITSTSLLAVSPFR